MKTSLAAGLTTYKKQFAVDRRGQQFKYCRSGRPTRTNGNFEEDGAFNPPAGGIRGAVTLLYTYIPKFVFPSTSQRGGPFSFTATSKPHTIPNGLGMLTKRE
jgi:hypothetical protein